METSSDRRIVQTVIPDVRTYSYTDIQNGGQSEVASLKVICKFLRFLNQVERWITIPNHFVCMFVTFEEMKEREMKVR